jgi:regulator of extracellular matrix RemA (YlzA/DUF370 family)
MLLNIGHSNSVAKVHVVGIVRNEGAAIRRHRALLKDSLKLIDATCGHKARSIIIMNSDHAFLSAIAAETLEKRFRSGEASETEM